MDWKSLVTQGPMTDEVLRRIFTSDQEMYPAPLTLDRLRQWVDAAPEMAACFYIKERSDKPGQGALIGTILALPLKMDSWEALLEGRLKETEHAVPRDVHMNTSNNPSAGKHTGLHVFHVEKFEPEPHAQGLPRSIRGFAQFALDAVQAAAKDEGLAVQGLSALTATKEGRRGFEKSGFEATGYEEVWVQKDVDGPEPATPQLVVVGPGEPLEAKVGEDEDRVVGRAQMMVRRHGQ